jgi:hypothetical protein
MFLNLACLALSATLGTTPKATVSANTSVTVDMFTSTAQFWMAFMQEPTSLNTTQPTALATIQAQDQKQTAANNKYVASMGPIQSPRDTAHATIGAAHVLVDYGRPSKKGRAIFGGLVPYDKVWRTGANAATVLVTDKDLTIGNLSVPAGSYTLYTLPSASGWKLIINREVGQWGLTYHKEFDLGQVPMTVSSAKSPVEKFLIDFDGGKMRLQWDTTVAEVPVAAKK